MEQLLLHLLGDFVVQNDWMALNKKKPGVLGFAACFIHCFMYSIPFLLVASPAGVFLVFCTHFLIDRSNFVTWILSVRNGCKYKHGYRAVRVEVKPI